MLLLFLALKLFFCIISLNKSEARLKKKFCFSSFRRIFFHTKQLKYDDLNSENLLSLRLFFAEGKAKNFQEFSQKTPSAFFPDEKSLTAWDSPHGNVMEIMSIQFCPTPTAYYMHRQ